MHVALFRRHGLTAREPYTKPGHHLLARAGAARRGRLPGRDDRRAGARASQLLRRETADLPPGDVFGRRARRTGQPGRELLRRPARELTSCSCFRLLKYLEVFPPIVGAIVVPGLVMLSLFLMPFVGRWELGHRFNVVWTFALLDRRGRADRRSHCATTTTAQTEHSQHYLAAVADADAKAERAVELAGSPTGIPPTGALALLRADRENAGPKTVPPTLCVLPQPLRRERHTGRRVARDRRRDSRPRRICGASAAAIGCWAFSIRKQIVGPALLRQHDAQRRRHGRRGSRTHSAPDAIAELNDDELAKLSARSRRRRASRSPPKRA